MTLRPVARQDVGAVAVGGALYFVGGFSRGRRSHFHAALFVCMDSHE
jgi:hypothetical protein